MDFVDPPCLFVLVDGVLGPRLFRALYRRYARSIDLQGHEHVLEFGCGSGGVSEYLAPRLKDGALVCLDISPPMLRIAEKRLNQYPNVRFLTEPVGNAGLEESSLDVVVIHNALHDVPNAERDQAVAVLAALLKPGGRICLREPTKPSHGLPAETFRAMMVEAGLVEIESSEYSVFPIGPVYDGVYVKPD
jgi:ubiquinone/menaquinone biosynthesis C-methylase UbiE